MRNLLTLAALLLSGCAPSGYAYDVGNFTHPHPTPALCASRGQVLDMSIQDCVTPAPPAPPSAAQIEQSQRMRADFDLLQRCDISVRGRYDATIAKLSDEIAEYMRHSHQNETAQEYANQNDISRMSIQLQAERLQACRRAAKG